MVSKSGCKGWLQQRTNLEKTLLSLSSLLLLTLLLVILFGISLRTTKTETVVEGEQDETCLSKECIRTVSQITSMMNSDKDSCTDFFQFSCGNYGKAIGQTKSVEQSSVDAVYFSVKGLLESSADVDLDGFDGIKSLYDNCISFGGVLQKGRTSETLRALWSHFGMGTWPVIDTFFEDSETLEQRLVNLMLVDVPVAFRIQVIPDVRISGAYLIKIFPGGPRESDRSADDIRGDVQLRANMMSSFLLLGASQARTTSDVDDILSTDAYFATVEKETNCDGPQLLSPQESLPELNRLIPDMNWTSVMSAIWRSTGQVRPYAVELHCKKKIREYLVQLTDITTRSSYNYLGWRFLSAFAEHVEPAFRRQHSALHVMTPRWRTCLELVERFAAPLLAQAITLQQDRDTESEVKKLVKGLESSAEKLISRAKWLSKQQKSRIIQQVFPVKFRIPFAKENVTLPIQIPIVNAENFTKIVIELQRQIVSQRFKTLSGERALFTNPSNPGKDSFEPWNSLLTTESSLHHSSEDLTMSRSVSTYLDKIREPFLRLHVPDWLNYGSFGVFIAREISKFLLSQRLGPTENDQATVWDAWISNKNASGCLLNVLASQLSLNIENEKDDTLLQELFLDHSSLEIAYQSAKVNAVPFKNKLPFDMDMSDEKMFFVSYTQGFCGSGESADVWRNIPINARLNSAVLDSAAFSDAFDCVSNSVKCQIWA